MKHLAPKRWNEVEETASKQERKLVHQLKIWKSVYYTFYYCEAKKIKTGYGIGIKALRKYAISWVGKT